MLLTIGGKAEVWNGDMKDRDGSEGAVPRLVFGSEASRPQVLFLGYAENSTRLIKALGDKGCGVWHCGDKITYAGNFDLLVCFGYRHILRKKFLDAARMPILNLHISLLPWNRGAHPNFWAFYDGTPSGVSIHFVDEGIDTGPILFQKPVEFSPQEKTFSQTYARLIVEIENLFIQNIDDIVAGRFSPRLQVGSGTFHRAADLPKDFGGWDVEIKPEIDRLRHLAGRK